MSSSRNERLIAPAASTSHQRPDNSNIPLSKPPDSPLFEPEDDPQFVPEETSEFDPEVSAAEKAPQFLRNS